MAEKSKKKVPGSCIFCGNYCEKGWDKNGRAYVMCRFCGTSLFLGTALAEAGHSIIHDMINSNIVSFKSELEKRLVEVRLKTSQTEKTRELDHTLDGLGIKIIKG